MRTKPIKVYYYKHGQLYKLSVVCQNGYKTLDDALSFVEAQLLKGRFRHLQIVFVEYKESYVSKIIHILNPKEDEILTNIK